MIKKYFLLMGLVFSLLIAQNTGDSSLDESEEEFSPSVLNKKFFLDYRIEFDNFSNFFQNGYGLIGTLDYVTPFSVITPFLTTGIGITPFTFYYGTGLSSKVREGLSIGLGYWGASLLNFKIDEKQLFIRNEKKFTNLGFLEINFSFSLLELSNFVIYGEYIVANVLDEATNEFINVITEQVSNEVNLNLSLLNDFGGSIVLKNNFLFRYLVKKNTYVIDYIFFLENVFSFDNFLEIAIIPKLLLSNSSNQRKVLNRSNFFKISPSPGRFLFGNRLVSSFQIPSTLGNPLAGLATVGLDLGYRIFPFSYIKQKNLFKGIYFQPTVYFGWIIPEEGNLSKSKTTISLVLTTGYVFPYRSNKLNFGIGWNDRQGMIINLGSSLYY